MDVSKYDADVFARFQNGNGFIGIGCFNSRVTGIFNEVYRVQSTEKLVFNDQNNNGRMS